MKRYIIFMFCNGSEFRVTGTISILQERRCNLCDLGQNVVDPANNSDSVLWMVNACGNGVENMSKVEQFVQERLVYYKELISRLLSSIYAN